MTILGGVGASIGGGLVAAGAGIQILPLNVADSFCHEVANWLVGEHCKRTGIQASLKGIIEGSIEIGPNGKTYRLKLQLSVIIAGVSVVKTFVAEVFIPFVGLPWEFKSCECVD